MLTFGRGVMVLAEGGTLRFENWNDQALTEASLRDAWEWIKSAAGRAYDWVSGMLAPLWDGFLDQMSGAEMIAQLDVADDWAEALQIRNKLRADEARRLAQTSWGRRLGELLASGAIAIGRTFTWPSRAFAEYVRANPDAAGLIVIYGAIAALASGAGAATGVGVLPAALFAALPGLLTLAAQMLTRRIQGDKPPATSFWASRNLLTGEPRVPYEVTTQESLYAWTDDGLPLEEGIIDGIRAVLAGISTAWRFPPRMIAAWAKERMRAAGIDPHDSTPDIRAVRGLTQDLADDLARLPDELEKAGIDTSSRAFKLGMSMTRMLSAPLRAIIDPIWAVMTRAVPGLGEMVRRYDMPGLRMALPMMFILGISPGSIAGMMYGPAAATRALINIGLPLAAITAVMGGYSVMATNTIAELERERT